VDGLRAQRRTRNGHFNAKKTGRSFVSTEVRNGTPGRTKGAKEKKKPFQTRRHESGKSMMEVEAGGKGEKLPGDQMGYSPFGKWGCQGQGEAEATG